jgi:hypothetical protein
VSRERVVEATRRSNVRKSPIAVASAAALPGVLASVILTSIVVSSIASIARLAGSVAEMAELPTETFAPPAIPAFVTFVTPTSTEPPPGKVSLSYTVSAGASPCQVKAVLVRADRTSAPALTEPVLRISEVDVDPSANARSALSVCAVSATVCSTAELSVTLPVVVIEPVTITSATSVCGDIELASASITRSAAPRSMDPVTVIDRALIRSSVVMPVRT